MTDTRPRDASGTIGPYRVIAVLGRGAMADVYEAVDETGARHAVKVLRPGGDADRAHRFAREGDIRVDHPNVVAVHGAGVAEDGRAWLAMEMLAGETLKERLDRDSRLPVEAALDIARQACRALGAIHAIGVIHRDVKPGNLFLCEDGTVKLLDFGVAHVRSGPDDLTVERQVIGTPSYLAPEQARGEPTIDLRADLWSLGVVLYEMLTGHRPFGRRSLVATLLAVVVDALTPITRHAPELPPGLVAVVHRCLAKRAEDRFESAEVLEAALAAVAAGDPAWVDTSPRLQLRKGGTVDVHAPTAETLALQRALPPIQLGERRLVALVLAEGLLDPPTLESAVVRRGGVFLRLAGGRAAGLFGAASWEGDEVERAAAAALVSRDAARAMAVVSGHASGDGSAVSGDVVVEAEACCRVGLDSVAVPPDTARLLEGAFTLKAERDGLFSVSASRSVGGPLSSEATRIARLVGRRDELAKLSELVTEVHTTGQAVGLLVTGPPGIGKSRLHPELERILEADRGFRIFVARLRSLSRGNAYELVREMLAHRARTHATQPGWSRLTGGVPLPERQSTVRALVREVIPEEAAAREIEGFLGELVRVPMTESALVRAARSDVQVMDDRLRLALLGYFISACQRGPVALLLDDLQWADAASLDFLDQLFDRASHLPLLLFATGRGELVERRPELFHGQRVEHFTLRGLDEWHVAELAAEVAGRELSIPLVTAIAARSGGNPLFVEQLVKAVEARGALDASPDELPLPVSVEAAVQSRLDHLPPDEKELCRRASVFGRSFDTADLAAVGVPSPRHALESLARRELVVPRPRPSRSLGQEHMFRSGLIQEVAYRMLADDLRRELHVAAAEHLEGEPEPDLELVAGHFALGGRGDRAASLYAQAALAAATRGDSETVLRCSGEALRLSPAAAGAYDLYVARADALRFLGRRDEQALELASALEAAGDDRQRARARLEQAVWLARTGNTRDALEALDAARDAADRSGDRELMAHARGRMAATLIFAGRLAEAAEALSTADVLAVDATAQTRGLLSEWRGLLANAVGDLGAQLAAYRAAVDLFAEAGDVRREAGAGNNVADVYNRIGAWDQAIMALKRTIDRCDAVGNHLVMAYALLNLGYAFQRRGRIGAAIQTLDRAIERAPEIGDVRLDLFARLYQARARLHVGDPGPVARDATAVARDADRHGLPGIAVLGRTLAAMAWLEANRPDAALGCSTEALRVRDELGSLEEDEAEVFVVHARALVDCGRLGEAREVRRRGRARLEFLADRIRDPDMRRRFLEDVPSHRDLMSG